ncbi:MAG: DUF4974 domain-containing protein [Rhodothermales bacterium]|nr:DUF4974 domain-containing protein [Rhodothermales bacterium]
MSYTPEQIISIDEWSTDVAASVRAALRDDPELRDAVRHWTTVSAAIGEELRRDLPSSEALVLYALRDSDHAATFSAEELDELGRASRLLESAIQKHPSVRHILDRIREEADDFERCWNEAAPVLAPTPARLDRAPVRTGRRMRLVAPRWIAAAAAVVVLVVSSTLLFGPDPDAGVDPVVWTADAGAYRVVELPDGTDLRLTGPATLTYSEDEPRSVELSGSAYFDVAHGTTRFTITTPTAAVEVLGTSFGVLSDDSSTEVTLVTGSLRLASSDGHTVQLEPGQQSRVERSGAPELPRSVDVTDVLRWTGLFVFRDTPITDVARTLSDEYDIQVDISDDLKDETLTGTFAEEQGVTEILRVISAAISAELDISEDGTRFSLKR